MYFKGLAVFSCENLLTLRPFSSATSHLGLFCLWLTSTWVFGVPIYIHIPIPIQSQFPRPRLGRLCSQSRVMTNLLILLLLSVWLLLLEVRVLSAQWQTRKQSQFFGRSERSWEYSILRATYVGK